MSDSDSIQDDGLGALALMALAVGAGLLWKMFGSSSKRTELEETSHFMQMANAFMEQGNYNEAIQTIRKAIEVNPTDPDPYNLIAWILAINNVALDEARVGAKKAIELASDSSNLANYYDTLAEVYARTGELEDAIFYFRKALNLAPNSDETHKNFSPSFRLALCYLGQGNYKIALFFLNRAIQVQPQNPFIYQIIGDCCLQIQHYIEATQHYQTALRLSQRWTNFYYPIMGNFEVDKERCIHQSIYWTNIGVAYFYLGEDEKSRDANEQALTLYRSLPYSWLNLAALSARNRDEQSMRQHLEKGLLLLNPVRDRHAQTYLITTQDFGKYRPIVLSLLRTHGLISEIEYRSLLGSTPQDGASPFPFAVDNKGVMIVGQANDVKGGPMSSFYQQGQKVKGNQYIAGEDMNIGVGRDFNIGTIQNKDDLITELEKLQTQLKKAKSDKVIDAKVVTEANHQLEQAIDQANSAAPEKHIILEYLEKARELIQGMTSAAGIVSTLVKLAEAIPRLF